MLKRGRLTAVAVIVAFLGAPATAQAAESIYGVTAGTTPSLVRFFSATPGTIEAIKPITGLQINETVLGIDVRPATGELMGVGSTGRLYRIDPSTGACTTIGPGSALAGTRFGVDFNPRVDRLRIVSDTEKNYRYNPLSGTLAFTDTDLAPAGAVVSAAYDRNTGGSPLTTLFALDATSNKLVRIGGVDGTPPPDGGAVSDIGEAGVDFAPTAGFDIAASDGTAYASLTVGATTSLYTIDLSTGAATKVADAGAAVIDIAVSQPKLTYYWSLATNALIRGRSDAPVATTADVVFLAGLAAGEFIVGLDQRPATGDLVALTNQDRLYLVDPGTGSAAQIGTAPLAPAVGSLNVGLDFNPVADRIRAVADNEKNLRLNPVTGTIVATDTALTPAGDVTAAAYLNSVPGAATTVLYDLDSATNTLLKQDPPNGGALTSIDTLTSSATGSPVVDIAPLNGFDIAPAGGFGFLLSRMGSANVNVLRVNLTESAVTGGRVVNAGEIPNSAVDATGLAIMSPGLLSAGSTTAGEATGTVKVVVLRSGGRSGPVDVEYATADATATAGQDYSPASGLLRFADGENAKIVDVPILDDSAVEGAEAFSLMLSKPGGGAVLSPTAAAVTITSEDVAPAATPTNTPPPPPPPPPDTTKPLGFVSITAGQSLRTVRSKGLKLKLVAGEPATASLSATITAATAKKLKLSSRRIATGKTTFTAAGVKSLTLTLSKKAKTGLARSRKPVAVTVAATLTDVARNVTVARGSAALPRR